VLAFNFISIGQNFDKASTNIKSGKYGKIEALIIANADSVIYQKYFGSFKKEDKHKCFSVTKSITSLLYGIAVKDGKLPPLETPVMNFFPEYKEIFQKDSLKRKITLYNLFTMTAGFEWKEFGGVPKKFSESDDFYRSILEIPLNSKPGEKFTYNSAVSDLLGKILERISGESYSSLLRDSLFLKLGIKDYELDFVSPSAPNSGAGLKMKAEDLVKIGQMLLKNGAGIIPEKWIDISTAKYIERGAHSDYGFQWWRYDALDSIAIKSKVNDIFFASGYGGQFLWVIPHLGITVVSFARNFDDGKLSHGIIRDYIIPISEK